jgi:hypothetical protein
LGPHAAEAALKRGLEELVWRSDGVDLYIKETLDLIKDLDGVLTTVKDNVNSTMDLMRTFERNLMFDRKVWLLGMDFAVAVCVSLLALL